jgi:[acyl-carrier-protein] S-malonyltransferase
MLSEHFSQSKEVNQIFDISREVLGIDFKKLIQDGSAEDLSPTQITQPLLLTANQALWKSLNIKPETVDLMAGHSLGEYSAYVAAESITFEEALELVSLRAKYMQEAVPEGEGGIAAIIGLSQDQLLSICNQITDTGQLVSMANLNSENQVVISGTKEGVERAIESCKENGAKRAIPLAMSVPSHCILMTPASQKFSAELDKIDLLPPKTKVIQNFSVSHTDDVQTMKDNLISQLYSPVRWSETMDYFIDAKITEFYECGPSKVLTGLIKRKFVNIELNSLDDYETLNLVKGK